MTKTYVANSNGSYLCFNRNHKQIDINVKDNSTDYDQVIQVGATESNQPEYKAVTYV